MHRAIEDVEFTIVDTETTGLNPAAGDRVVELAALKCRGAQKIASFQTLVNPCREISPGAFAVNRISQDMLRDAPTMDRAMPGFLDFVGDSCLCSYNMPFDLGFLNSELRLIGMPPFADRPAVDILTMSRRLLPGLPRHALWFVSQHLGLVAAQEHRALSDVELTWGVFVRLVGMLREKGVIDFKTFLRLFSLNFRALEDEQSRKVAEIQEAIDLGARLRIKYLSTTDARITLREVIPREVRRQDRRLYLIGFCCLRNEERAFNVDHIIELEVL